MKCKGTNCPIRNDCLRYDAKFHLNTLVPPFTIKNGLFCCPMYCGTRQSMILDQLKEIVTGKSNDAYCKDYCRFNDGCDFVNCKLRR